MSCVLPEKAVPGLVSVSYENAPLPVSQVESLYERPRHTVASGEEASAVPLRYRQVALVPKTVTALRALDTTIERAQMRKRIFFIESRNWAYNELGERRT